MVLIRGAACPVNGLLVAFLAVCLLVPSAAGIASTGKPDSDVFFDDPALVGPDLSCPQAVPACPWTDESVWLEWAEHAELEEIITATRTVMSSFEEAMPLPDVWPEYGLMDDGERRSLWLGAWFQPRGSATSPGMEGFSYEPGSVQTEKILMQQNGGGAGGDDDSPEEEESKLGDAMGLRPLWSMIMHGSPEGAHPADDEDAWALVTNHGVVYIPDGDEEPEWLLRLEPFWGGASQVSEPGPDGDRLIGVEQGDRGRIFSISFSDGIEISRAPARGLFIIDLGAGELQYEGFFREDDEQAVEWTFTDVKQDGTDELLVVTDNRELVAVRPADGEEVYRTSLPGPVGEELLEEEGGVGSYTSPVFGDATGDGIQDLYVFHSIDLSLEGEAGVQAIMVTLVGGANGEALWQVPLDIDPLSDRLPGTRVTGDITGDGQDDLVFSERRLMVDEIDSTTVTGLSAQDGTRVFFDDSRAACPVEALCVPPYHPVAIVDRDGNGMGDIVGLEPEADSGRFALPVKSLVVRSAPLIPGTGTQPVLHEDVALPAIWMSEFQGHLETWHDHEAGTGGILIAPSLAETDQWPEAEGVEWVYRVGPDGFEQINPRESLAAFAVHPDTGATKGWILKNDHWAPLGEELNRLQPGFRLILSGSPRLHHDADGDGVPDFLYQKTAGYHWVNGRNGSVLADVDRPWHNRHVDEFDFEDGIYALESLRGSGTEYRFGPLEGEAEWAVKRDDLGGDRIQTVRDYTDDGDHELLVYIFPNSSPEPIGDQYGRGEDEAPPRWFVRTAATNEPLWEFEPALQDYNVNVETLKPLADGTVPLLASWKDGGTDRLHVSLHVVGEGSPRWEKEFNEETRLGDEDEGRFIVQEKDEEEGTMEVSVHRVRDGKADYRIEVPDEKEFLFSQLIDLGTGGTHLVVSYGAIPAKAPAPSPDAEPPEVEQRFLLFDANGERLSSWITVDPGGEAVYDSEEDDWRIQSSYGWSRFMGTVGDWDGDGQNDLALHEESRTTVRSSVDGSLLAVSPEEMTLWYGDERRVDLNNDGRKEIGLNGHRVSLAWYAYDPEGGPMNTDDDDNGRLDLRKNQTRIQDLDEFFDGEQDTPMGSVWVLLAVLSAVLIAVRRQRDR